MRELGGQGVAAGHEPETQCIGKQLARNGPVRLPGNEVPELAPEDPGLTGELLALFGSLVVV